MRVKIMVCMFMIILCSNIVAAVAQDTTMATLPFKWNLENCIDYAKKNNIQINSLVLTEKTAEQELLLSKAAKLPGISASVGHSVIHSNNTNPVVGGFQTQASFSGSYSVGSLWIVYNGGYLNNVVKQNQLNIQSANLNVLQQENNITLQITQAYLNILLAKENIVYAEDLVKTSQAQLNRGQQQFNAGSIARVNVLELQSQLATDKYNLTTAQNIERQNKLALKQLLLLPSSVNFDIAVPDTLMGSALIPSLEEAQKAALSTRPEIKNGELGIKIAELDLAKAKAGYYPTATIGASLATGYSNNNTDAYLKQIDNNFYQQIGLTLSVPIFTKRAVKTNVENAKIEIAQSELSLKGTQITLSQTVEQAYINVLNAQSQYDASVEQLNSAKESFRVVTEQLNAGAANMVDYLTQKNLYVQSLQSYIQAKYNTALNIRIYEFYMGTPMKL
ncbi:MAG TPA: TolC family protein [Puia sp.]|nr:TolC family protein [Puia sp.]